MSEENQNQFHMRGMKPTLEALKSSEAIASGSSVRAHEHMLTYQ
jgi:hypothetical protein